MIHSTSFSHLLQVLEDHTLVRDSQDASYLLNLMVDSIVDVSYPIVDSYTEQVRFGSVVSASWCFITWHITDLIPTVHFLNK